MCSLFEMSSFGVRVMLVSSNELRNDPSPFIF